MAFSKNNQNIQCEVESCRHWGMDGSCELESIRVAPRQGCNSGDCDESQCDSYHCK